MNEVFVNMGEIHVLQGTGILTTVGLGSCVGVTLYDQQAKVGAMAHVFLSESQPTRDPNAIPGKYADTAIPELIRVMVRNGAQRRRLVAKIAGGAHLFSNITGNRISVGDKNIAAVIEHLQNEKIPLKGKDVAGNKGRKMRLYVESGNVVVTTIGKEAIEI